MNVDIHAQQGFAEIESGFTNHGTFHVFRVKTHQEGAPANEFKLFIQGDQEFRTKMAIRLMQAAAAMYIDCTDLPKKKEND